MENIEETKIKELISAYITEMKEKTDHNYPAFSGHSRGYYDCLRRVVKDLDSLFQKEENDA
jgi:hypothetical protein